MAEYNELIKNFERIRDYMREFFVYGFKVRGDYTEKSTRTYDNEKRRIESYLGKYMEYRQTSRGKMVSILVDSGSVFQNPLYAAWKAKSFTDNDIMLHFFLLDLMENKAFRTTEELANEISIQFGQVFDTQIVRLKLKEYEKAGIFETKKVGKRLLYGMRPQETYEQGALYDQLMKAISFFHEPAPLGVIGSTLLDHERDMKPFCSFKHHFLVHTLEDGILLELLEVMKEHKGIQFENRSSRTKTISQLAGIPLKILISTQTGRRYVAMYFPKRERFTSIRIDSISGIKRTYVVEDYGNLQEKLEGSLTRCWGVSFGGNIRNEEIYMKLYIDERNEGYILNRLEREGRGGEILRVKENVFLYHGVFYDTNEMLPWVKTFVGRILDVQGTNQFVMNKLHRDLDQMYTMYFREEQDGTIF